MLLAFALCLLAAFPWFEATRNANEVPRLMQGRALVEDGRWDLGAPSVAGAALGPDLARGPDGRIFPNKPPGASVVAAGAYASAQFAQSLVDGGETLTLRRYGWWARLALGVLPSLFIIGLALRRWTEELGPAAVSMGAAVWLFATPAFSYAHLAYGHQLTGALVFAGVVEMGRAVRDGRVLGAALGGLAAGSAVAVEYGAVFAALPIAALLLPGLNPRRDLRARPAGTRVLVAALVAALVPIVGLAAYQSHAFGSWHATGYHNVTDPGFAAKHAQGLLGLGWPSFERAAVDWIALDTGLLAWAPAVALGFIGLAQLSFGTHPLRREARTFLGLWAVMALVGAGLSFEGGWRVGPRYLVFALPGLILGWAHLYNQCRYHAGALAVFFVPVFYGMAMNLLAGTLWPHVDPTHVARPFDELLWPLLRGGHHPYGMGDFIGVGVLGSWMFSLGLPLLVFAVLIFASSQFDVVVAGALVGSVVVTGTLLTGLPTWADGAPRAEANLRYVESVYEPAPGLHERKREASMSLPLPTSP